MRIAIAEQATHTLSRICLGIHMGKGQGLPCCLTRKLFGCTNDLSCTYQNVIGALHSFISSYVTGMTARDACLDCFIYANDIS